MIYWEKLEVVCGNIHIRETSNKGQEQDFNSHFRTKKHKVLMHCLLPAQTFT